MNGLTMGLIMAAGMACSPHPGQPDGPLFDLLAEMPPDHHSFQEKGLFVQAPVRVPEAVKNSMTMGAGFSQSLAFFIVLKLDKDMGSRELTLSPLFFVPWAPGFLNVKVLVKEPKKES